jgi:hypothetical protein
MPTVPKTTTVVAGLRGCSRIPRSSEHRGVFAIHSFVLGGTAFLGFACAAAPLRSAPLRSVRIDNLTEFVFFDPRPLSAVSDAVDGIHEVGTSRFSSHRCWRSKTAPRRALTQHTRGIADVHAIEHEHGGSVAPPSCACPAGATVSRACARDEHARDVELVTMSILREVVP